MREILDVCHNRPIKDIHTHREDANLNAVLNVEPLLLDENAFEQWLDAVQQPFSLSLHPWHLKEGALEMFVQRVEQCREHPWLYALGECGLDACASTPMLQQREVWRGCLTLALQMRKPIIVHCVKAWEALIADVRAVRKAMGGTVAMGTSAIIVHGFRKGPGLAQQLLKEGFCLSLGEHFNVQTVGVIPQDRLFCETDESALTIEIIKQNIEKYEIL